MSGGSSEAVSNQKITSDLCTQLSEINPFCLKIARWEVDFLMDLAEFCYVIIISYEHEITMGNSEKIFIICLSTGPKSKIFCLENQADNGSRLVSLMMAKIRLVAVLHKYFLYLITGNRCP